MYATIGSHTFQGGSGDSLFTLTNIQGWWGGSDFRHEQQARLNGDGDFDAPVYRGGRILTLEGHVQATSTTQFENALDILDNLLGDGSMGTLTVVQGTGSYSLQVRRHGGLNLDILVYGELARYQFQLWAPDPAKE